MPASEPSRRVAGVDDEDTVGEIRRVTRDDGRSSWSPHARTLTTRPRVEQRYGTAVPLAIAALLVAGCRSSVAAHEPFGALRTMSARGDRAMAVACAAVKRPSLTRRCNT